jgi:sterol desaturase/sphingolipid hydroxylase (fatty acid hydroxylase superfamily)
VAFVVVCVLYFYVRERKNPSVSIFGGFNFAFPVRLFKQNSTRIDFFNLILRWVFFNHFVKILVAFWSGVNINHVLVAAFGARAPCVQNWWIILFIQFMTDLTGQEFGFYAIHYCFHKVPWMWSFHRAHHSAEALTFMTGGRGHPLGGCGAFIGLIIRPKP